MVPWGLVLAFAAITFTAGFIGVVFILLNIRWSGRKLRRGIGFGAGILIGLSFLEVLPEALDLAPAGAMFFVLAGFMGFFLVEQFLQIHRFEHFPEKGGFHFSKAAFLALCLHALLDGTVIGLGLHVGEAFGLIVFAAILFHKLPVSVSVASVFLGMEEKRSAVLQMLAFACATPVGLLAAFAGLGDVPECLIGSVLALSAGMFLYLGATDMLPEVAHGGHHGNHGPATDHERASRWISWEPTFWVFVGLAVSFLPDLLGTTWHHH